MREDQLYRAGEVRVRSAYYHGNDVPMVVLPHSCDGWKIGGADQVRQLIADLTALLESEAIPALPEWAHPETDEAE